MTLLAVPNVSDGRDHAVLDAIGAALTAGGVELAGRAREEWPSIHGAAAGSRTPAELRAVGALPTGRRRRR